MQLFVHRKRADTLILFVEAVEAQGQDRACWSVIIQCAGQRTLEGEAIGERRQRIFERLRRSCSASALSSAKSRLSRLLIRLSVAPICRSSRVRGRGSSW